MKKEKKTMEKVILKKFNYFPSFLVPKSDKTINQSRLIVTIFYDFPLLIFLL